MYTIGLTHASDFSRFFSRQIIHELELTEESTCLFLASIDEDDGNVSTDQHKHVYPFLFSLDSLDQQQQCGATVEATDTQTCQCR